MLSQENPCGRRCRLEFFDGETLCTTIDADFAHQTLHAVNHVDNTTLFSITQFCTNTSTEKC